jgi:hypothetical protein
VTILRIGLPQNVADINNRAGQIYLNLRGAFQDVQNFQAMLTTLADADLQAADQNGKAFTASEVSNLKSAYTDLDKLRGIFQGTQTQGSTYDFRTFAKLLGGVS